MCELLQLSEGADFLLQCVMHAGTSSLCALSDHTVHVCPAQAFQMRSLPAKIEDALDAQTQQQEEEEEARQEGHVKAQVYYAMAEQQGGL